MPFEHTKHAVLLHAGRTDECRALAAEGNGFSFFKTALAHCLHLRRFLVHVFADDFVGISDSKESLQKLLDVVYSYCSKWRLRANVSKSAVMVFSKDAVNGCWKWGEYSLPIVSSYS